MKYVVIVNGKPESGKTTFEKLCREYLDLNEWAYCHIISTIDPIKDIYKSLGWDGITKTDGVRKDLSTLKKMWIDVSDGPTKYIIKKVLSYSDNDGDHVIFVDIREESEIIKLVNIISALDIIDIKYKTVFVTRDYNAGIEHGNKSDDSVGENMSIYDTIIENNGTFDELRYFAKRFITTTISNKTNSSEG